MEIVQPEQQKEKYILKNENESMKQHQANQCEHDISQKEKRKINGLKMYLMKV